MRWKVEPGSRDLTPDINMRIQKCSHTYLSIPNHLVLHNGSLTLLVWVVWLEEFWLVASRLPHAPPSSLSQTMHRTIKRSMRELIILSTLDLCTILMLWIVLFLACFSESSRTPEYTDKHIHSNVIFQSTFNNHLFSVRFPSEQTLTKVQYAHIHAKALIFSCSYECFGSINPSWSSNKNNTGTHIRVETLKR